MNIRKMPLVSIVMPAYNGEKYIGQAIESVLNQTYDNWELDIVDDASTDATLDVIKRYNDKRIKLQKNIKNRGIAYSSNIAIDMSDSKYIAFLDDDDMATEERLEIQVEYLEEHPDIDVLGGRAILINEESEIIGYDDTPLYNPKLIKAYLNLIDMRFTNGTTMIRRALLEENGLRFEDECYGMQDSKLMMDASKVGKLTSIDRLLMFKRIHDNEFTTIMRNDSMDKRRECTARIQRESLEASGFVLNEEQLYMLGKYITERAPMPTDEEVIVIWGAMSEIIRQSYDRDLDYAKEMEYACKKLLCDRFLVRRDYGFIDKILK